MPWLRSSNVPSGNLEEDDTVKRFEEVLDAIREYPVKHVAVACADDATVLRAAADAQEGKIATCTLVGDRSRILETAAEEGLDIDASTVIDEPDDIVAARRAVSLVSAGQADIVMKGMIHTDDFLRAVLDRDVGLRSGTLMSHVFVLESDDRDRFILATDGAMNIAPTFEQKAEIIMNAIHLAAILGIEEPRVACLAAVEVVNPAMPATLEAACLAKMSERLQYSPRAIVDGPLALDNAIYELAAKHKRIGGPVAGRADILVVPDVESGNMLAKAFVYFGGGRVAGVVVGARAPVVLTSRADSAESKLMSIALAVLIADVERHVKLKVGKVHY